MIRDALNLSSCIEAKTTTPQSIFRTRSIEDTLRLARLIAPLRGITRVTDTTPLDRLGIPVFSSIRPSGAKGSLCVHAGKGATLQDAKVGAYMEAIEFSYAEIGKSPVKYFLTEAQEMLSSYGEDISFSDFCPLMGRTCAPEEKIKVVSAELVGKNKKVLVPAELVFLPLDMSDENPYFCRGSSIGLASGNSVLEASVHALAEIIEHDIASFEFIADTSRMVNTEKLSGIPATLIKKIKDADFHVYVRYVENCFNIPYFHAVIIDKTLNAAVNVCGGYGVHPNKEIAIVRALTEAAQSRLSTIHGGRDDLTKYPDIWLNFGRDKEIEALNEYRTKISDSTRSIDFDAIEDWSNNANSIPAAWKKMESILKINGMNHILRVTFTEPNDLLHVVKLIIPKMEACTYDSMRFGPRLRKYVANL
jgi:ribosomal protein S12 methylthiotransferase accessory factor